MSACAGSSTERGFGKFTSCVPPEQSGPQEQFFSRFRRPGPDGSRARQERVHEHAETGKPLAAYKVCTGTRSEALAECGIARSSARHGIVQIASGGTAPPGFPAWLATKSLQSGYRIVQLVRFVQMVGQYLRRGSPPFRAGRGAETGTPAIHGSSLPHIPSPSGLARLHPTLPRVPAGRRRWAERYDGKGNLYLQHAA